MLVMVGDTRSRTNIAFLRKHGWGRMVTVMRPAPFNGEQWGFDNGAFKAWSDGKPFPEFDFIRRLEEVRTMGLTPYMAVTPDIVASGLHSLDFSLSWREKLPNDWPWYLAVQDGMTVSDCNDLLQPFAGIFLGGTDRFKGTAYRWRKLAHDHGKKFHYGRAGTPKKLVSAYRVGSDSCDSAFPLWSRERFETFIAKWQGLGLQRRIEEFLTCAEAQAAAALRVKD